MSVPIFAADPFPPVPPSLTAVSTHAAGIAYPAEYVVEQIVKLSNYIIDISSNSALLGKASRDPSTPSVYTLFARLQNKQFAPTLLPADFQTPQHLESRMHQRASQDAASRPLADYEDLYYALLARIHEIDQILRLRVQSGFNDVADLVCTDGPSLGELHAKLMAYWGILNDPACGKVLDEAVREARVHAMHDEIFRQVEKGGMTVPDAQEHLKQLYSPAVYAGVLGLTFVPNWAPAIVGIYLEQKYRPLLDLEKEHAQTKAFTQHRAESIRIARGLAGRGPIGGELAVQAAAEPVDTEAQREASAPPTPVQADFESALSEARSSEELDQANEQFCLEHMDKLSLQHAPEHQVQFHDGHHHHHQAQSATLHDENYLERARAFEVELDEYLDWYMRTQRVSAYSSYLRDRAIREAQNADPDSGDDVDRLRGPFLDVELALLNEMQY